MSKRYLILGGTSGVGYATAEMLVKLGNEVVLAARDQEKLHRCAKEFSSPTSIRVDLSTQDPAEFASLLIDTFQRSPFDGIFHAAGEESIRPAYLTKAAHWSRAPTFGLLAIARSVKHILINGGSIVAMSSVAAHKGCSTTLAYGAERAAVESMVRTLAVELAPTYRVNAVAAGAFKSAMHDRIAKRMGPSAIMEYEGKHLLGFGTSRDVAMSVCFLLSNETARWITGTTLVCDGGYSVKG